MQWIPPDTIRVIVPAGTVLHRGKDTNTVTACDHAVDIEVSYSGIEDLAWRACRNRSRKAVDGPLTAKPIGKVETSVVPK